MKYDQKWHSLKFGKLPQKECECKIILESLAVVVGMGMAVVVGMVVVVGMGMGVVVGMVVVVPVSEAVEE